MAAKKWRNKNQLPWKKLFPRTDRIGHLSYGKTNSIWGILLPACFERMRSFRRFIVLTILTLIAIESVQIFTMLGSFDIGC